MYTIKLNGPANKDFVTEDQLVEMFRSLKARCKREPIAIEYIRELSNGSWSKDRLAYIDENAVCARIISVEVDELKCKATAVIEPHGPLKAVMQAHLSTVDDDANKLVFMIRGTNAHIVTYDYMGSHGVYQDKLEEKRRAEEARRHRHWW